MGRTREDHPFVELGFGSPPLDEQIQVFGGDKIHIYYSPCLESIHLGRRTEFCRGTEGCNGKDYMVVGSATTPVDIAFEFMEGVCQGDDRVVKMAIIYNCAVNKPRDLKVRGRYDEKR